jgi:hypothetical protein
MYGKLKDDVRANPPPRVFSQRCDSMEVKGCGCAKDVIQKELRGMRSWPRPVARRF